MVMAAEASSTVYENSDLFPSDARIRIKELTTLHHASGGLVRLNGSCANVKFGSNVNGLVCLDVAPQPELYGLLAAITGQTTCSLWMLVITRSLGVCDKTHE